MGNRELRVSVTAGSRAGVLCEWERVRVTRKGAAGAPARGGRGGGECGGKARAHPRSREPEAKPGGNDGHTPKRGGESAGGGQKGPKLDAAPLGEGATTGRPAASGRSGRAKAIGGPGGARIGIEDCQGRPNPGT
ncbi:hypothetical protein KI387_012610, partial [Taxus chinensis]